MLGRKAKRIRDLEGHLQHAERYTADLIGDIDKLTGERDALARQFAAFCDQLELRLQPAAGGVVRTPTLSPAQQRRSDLRVAGPVPMCTGCPHERLSHDSNGCMEGPCRCEIPYHSLVKVTLPARPGGNGVTP